MRWVLIGGFMLGLAAIVGLVDAGGTDAVLRAFEAVGWALVAIVGLRVLAIVGAGLAWRAAMDRLVSVPLALFLGLRFVREAINCLLPVAQVGGDMIGGRLLARAGVAPGLAAAGILLDLLLQAATQGAYALTGLAVLWWVEGDRPVTREAALALELGAPLLLGFFLAQRLGLFALVDYGVRLAQRLWPARAGTQRFELQPALSQLYQRPRAVALGALVHFAAWNLGAVEIWLALSRIDGTTSAAECIVLESLGQAVRSAAFVVPGALGIQEGGFVALGALFGLPVASCIALSLVKRVPDLVIGVPGLLAWQWLEIRTGRVVLAYPAMGLRSFAKNRG